MPHKSSLHHTPSWLKSLIFLLTLTGFFTFPFSSCRQNNQQEKVKTTDSTPNNPAIPMKDTSLMSLKKFAGSYPSDVNLLEQPEIKERLKTILGAEYDNFRKYWQTETPIELEEHVLSTTGCEQHNCAANQYVLQIDLTHNNINVYHFGENGIQSYLEKGIISLPPEMAKEFQMITNNSQTPLQL